MGEMKPGGHLPRFIKLKDEAGEESVHYNTVNRDCPEEVKRYAERELNETEENKRKGLEKLKAYLKSMKFTVYDYADLAVYVQAVFFCIFKYPLPTIKGLSIIIDCNVKSPSVIFRVINEYRKYLGFEKTIPLRISRIDFVNENVIFHNAFALLRPFLPSKISDRIAFHGSDLRKLHKIYHPALLPDEFGGTLGPVDTSLFKEDKLRTINKLKAENFI